MHCIEAGCLGRIWGAVESQANSFARLSDVCDERPTALEVRHEAWLRSKVPAIIWRRPYSARGRRVRERTRTLPNSVCLLTTGEITTKMSYSNERMIAKLRLDVIDEEPIRALEELDREIDVILRTGGTSLDVRPTQRRFNEVLANVRSRERQSELRSSA